MKQNQMAVLIVGILILIFGGAFLFFQKDVQNFFKEKLDTKNQDISKSPEEKVLRDKTGKRIDARLATNSQIAEYEIKVNEEQKLINTLIDWGLFGKTFAATKEELVKENPLELITIILTDKKQPHLLEGKGDNQLVSSAGYELNGNEIKILVYISSDSLNESNLYFEKQALKMLHVIAYPPIKGMEQSQTDSFDSYFEDKNNTGTYYFKIERK